MIRNVVFFCFIAFTGRLAGQPLATGKVVDPVRCAADPSLSYAVYIPAAAASKPAPVIYFFDPHGDGALPLAKYRSLADQFGYVLVGSNDSRNGNDWSQAAKIWQAISADSRTRLRIDNRRIYTAGFSGGAKVASYTAIQDASVRGCIVGGAGLPDGVTPGDLSFSLTILAGEGDMNLTELAGLSQGLDRTRTRHRLIAFEGRHEWAPAASMRTAFTALAFDAIAAGTAPKDAGLIRQYAADSRKRVEGAIAGAAFIQAVDECRLALALLDGLSDDASWFRSKAASLSGDPRYAKQRQAREALLGREGAIKNEYMQHFQNGDMAYWAGVVKDLDMRMAPGASAIGVDERAMYQRLQAFLSLAFYSFSNRLIAANENAGARHFTDLYKLADPTNTEAWYFSALLYARAGNAAAAKQELARAVRLGFTDRARVSQQREFAGAGIRL